jgi:signal transduction histidine kinase
MSVWRVLNAIITTIDMKNQSLVKPGSNADIAFAVVVLASYFATFSNIRQANLWDILLMLGLGLAYILIGIYGYAYCARSNLSIIRIGYFFIQIPLGGLIVSLGKGAGYNGLLLMPLVGHAVVLLSEIWVYIVNIGILTIFIISTGSYTPNWSDVWAGMPIFLAGQIFIMVFTQSSVSEERSRREVERLVEELKSANTRLQEYANRVEELAVTQERNRLAREIHDGLGHYLTTIFMEIQAAQAVMTRNPERAQVMLQKAQTLTQDALTDVRNSVAALRASPEENLPLPRLLENLLDHCDMLNIETDLKILGTPRTVPPQVHLTLYRAAQESINNIRKHAHASQVWIRLDYQDLQKVRFMIQDNGIGAERLDGGFGLIGLQERVNLLNGEMQIQTAKDQGLRMEIIVPT